MSGADVGGLVGLILALVCVMALGWPSYEDERDFASPADRRDAESKIDEHRRGDPVIGRR